MALDHEEETEFDKMVEDYEEKKENPEVYNEEYLQAVKRYNEYLITLERRKKEDQKLREEGIRKWKEEKNIWEEAKAKWEEEKILFEESKRQMRKGEEQQDRFDRILDKWERQQKQFQKYLDRLDEDHLKSRLMDH